MHANLQRWRTPPLVAVSIALLLTATAAADFELDADYQYTWTENAGWIDWLPAVDDPNEGLFIGTTYLAGFVWAENVGWINLGRIPLDLNTYSQAWEEPLEFLDFGVNMDEFSGELFGLAWGENVGWISFNENPDVPDDGAVFDPVEQRFYGFAWGENIGWINLDESHAGDSGLPYVCGDANCDGMADVFDIDAFVLAITNRSQYDATYGCIDNCDTNCDSNADVFDIDTFVAALTGVPCDCGQYD